MSDLKNSILTFMIALASITLIACSVPLNTTQEVASSLVIKYATLRVIEKSEDPVNVANRIIVIAEDANTIIGMGQITLVSELDKQIRSNINWSNMDASQVLLVETLLSSVKSEIENRITGGTLNPNAVMTVGRILSNITSAARIYSR